MSQRLSEVGTAGRESLPFGVTHETVGTTVVQDLTGWEGETDGLGAVESAWMEIASQSDVTAAVTEFSTEMLLGADTQKHLAGEWSANADAAGVERIAFVSDGIKARAVSANLDVEQEVQTFTSRSAAIEWANEV